MADGPKHPGGRPPVVLSDAQRVEVEELARVGMTKDLIADHLGVARSTLYCLMDRDEVLARSYARGMAEGLAMVHRSCFAQAQDGNPAMIQLILKTKGGWRETPQAVELSGPEGKPIETKDVSARDILADRISALASRIGADGGTGEPD